MSTGRVIQFENQVMNMRQKYIMSLFRWGYFYACFLFRSLDRPHIWTNQLKINYCNTRASIWFEIPCQNNYTKPGCNPFTSLRAWDIYDHRVMIIDLVITPSITNPDAERYNCFKTTRLPREVHSLKE